MLKPLRLLSALLPVIAAVAHAAQERRYVVPAGAAGFDAIEDSALRVDPAFERDGAVAGRELNFSMPHIISRFSHIFALVRVSVVAGFGALSLLAAIAADDPSARGGHVLTVAGANLLLDGAPVKLIGLRLSNALMSDATTQELIDHLGAFHSYGVNAISVFVMGSRFGDVKGFRPDASLDPVYRDRLARIITAADGRAMVVLVGCLYWSESEANAELGHWTQREANLAVQNVVRWLKENRWRNVFVDPDNEGMANKEKGWSIEQMIDAGHRENPSCVIAHNARRSTPSNADLTVHFGRRVPGKPHVETEGTPNVVPYWQAYSRKEGYRNYLNIGIYSEAMKAEQRRVSSDLIENANGYLLASTWLQCPPPFGPNMRPEGDGSAENPGIKWWLDYIKARYGGRK